MAERVYVETTVVSYLTAWPSQDVVVAGHQQITRTWWNSCRDTYELVASQQVVQEASAGDPVAAKERMDVLATMTLLTVTDEAVALAEDLIRAGAVPEKASEDALHIAVAVTNGIDYLLTWNCRHLANATLRSAIEAVCRSAGYEPVVICTPEELLEV